jgi:peptide/nickel transport system substrate-binding protein
MKNNLFKPTLLRLFVPFFLLTAIACRAQSPAPGRTTTPDNSTAAAPTATVTPTPIPPRFLTICLGQEPESLFLYGDQSLAARSVREAIYDGPYDLLNFEMQPVILEKHPALADGDAALEAVTVYPGQLIVDKDGSLATLSEGTAFYPAGCQDLACAQVYSGSDPVSMDQLAVRFRLKPGIAWSDGTSLTAADSVYSFQVARALFPRYRPDLLNHTQAYTALDESTVEWRGVPGYRDPQYATNFFSPLPQHAWGVYQPEQLLSEAPPSRQPLGWGPYVIDEWTSGDHISLSVNPNYFRLSAGLPAFDHLVFRFISNGDEALAALLAGECDVVDKTALSEEQNAALAELQGAGKLAVAFENGSAWEHADFGVATLSQGTPSLFQSAEMRQAIALCLDRESLAAALFPGQSQVPATYLHPSHPFFNPEASTYAYDPGAAANRLTSLGWIDEDNNPQTPRRSVGVPGVPDGSPLEISYQTIDGAVRRAAAEMIKTSLAACGVQLNVTYLPADQLFAPGPEGSVFGRNFQMAQFGWETSPETACFLYTTQEIPGPYPDYPKGWGGANLTGYSSPGFDQACETARNTLPDQPEYAQAQRLAQSIFAEDLPVIPLYLIPSQLATRLDMCGVQPDPSASSALWNLEAFDYGEACQTQP